MDSSALLFQTGPTTFTGSRIFSPQIWYHQYPAQVREWRALTLEQVPIASTLSLEHLYWDGPLLDLVFLFTFCTPSSVLWIIVLLNEKDVHTQLCNCLLFVDVTNVALEWAQKNVESNPRLAELIEIRNANAPSSESESVVREAAREKILEPAEDVAMPKPHILVGVVKESESFDFCMCNPPFFESIEEAGLNPKTSCGGTAEEMVCPGGELAFVTQIIEDSVSLKNSFR